MKLGKTPLVAAALVAVVGATAIGASAVSAAGGAGNGPFTDLASAIATRFNVDATEVQAIINEHVATHQEERHAEMEANMAERLAAAVTAGKLTQAQADALTAHRAEMETLHEAHREQMDAFLEEQGIDKSVLGELMGGPGRGPGGHRGGFSGPRGEK
jgi:ABC-type uncharacterized transport system ATPase component